MTAPRTAPARWPASTFADEIARGRVTVLRQENGGKAKALNYGLQFVTEEIFVGIDADTLIANDAIAYLVPHFQDARVGAMAGNAKVGNRVNLWTRWQALEYITSQNFDRRALNTFSAVCVVPGAIGAWRTEAVRAAGGYKTDTVAEDADLTMALLQNGYKVEYEDRALAYTEAPTTANGLMRQRFRWSFGILQAVWKHRSAFARKGALGFVALPNIVIFQILLPLVSPFIDIMFVVGSLKYLIWDKHFHPETADPASFEQLVLFFLMFLVIDFIASVIAFSLERRHGRDRRDWWLLGHVWLQRFAYRQLFSVVLIKTLRRAIDGRHFSWDKLERTATVTEPERRRQLSVSQTLCLRQRRCRVRNARAAGCGAASLPAASQLPSARHLHSRFARGANLTATCPGTRTNPEMSSSGAAISASAAKLRLLKSLKCTTKL